MENLNPKDLLDVRTLVRFGTRAKEDYQVLFYKEVYGKEVNVRIRGLSTFEYEEISLKMYSQIKDPETIAFVFNPKNEDKDGELKEGEEAEEDIDVDSDDANFNPAELTNAYVLRNVWIIYYAMKDFYKNLTLDTVKELEGISEIAHRINEKSGRTVEVLEKIKSFRLQRSQSGTEVSDEAGTKTKRKSK